MRISDWSSDVCSSDLRLDRIASVRLIVLKADANSPLLLELLQRIGRMAELDGIAAIVAVPHAGLDDAYAALGDAPVDLLCDPIEGDLTAAIALSLQAAQSTLLHDIGRESESLRLQQRSEEHKSELQTLMRISYAVSCLKKQI